ncbi:dihydrolipoyllysine-residue succinyltransferase [Lysobacter sp. GX 14042]|uniref:dihydrolipoyllysine-residue succinyltransferase n=1 Tax=Lysobacter sp. GX 14042 TaxID=2907155 RepID=UPI001F46AFDC|nr:dihydrolipoyllysine-residue succinyltransferase [Lysobacter sp. GX 14042]MCE7031253.1 dihydrolipoyllysine-residue succinyltransferase [Lysobacter sp. GX 14042]
MSTEIKVPVLPESVSDATIATWHKKPGDAVSRDENLVDLETDKVVLEVPSPVDGVLKEIKFDSGDTVTSEQVLAIVEEGAVAAGGDKGKDEAKAEGDKADAGKQDAKKGEPAKAAAPSGGKADELPPGARFTANKEGIDPSQVEGSGRRGAVTKEDLVNYARNAGVGKAGGNRPEERVPMTRMRARIAERLMQSKDSIAMLTSFNEINMKAVMDMRKQHGEAFLKAHGIKLGFMSFFVKAAANALQRYPVVNASVDGNDILYRGYADVSIAVSTEKGLVTPVLRNAESMGFADIEKQIADYATRARDGKLTLDDLQGGTFTITNGGTFGSLFSTPIVNPPQSAILGMHAIKEQAIVENGQVVAAPMMYVAISYDHRIIDGKDAVLFLVDIKNQLENPQRMLLDL